MGIVFSWFARFWRRFTKAPLEEIELQPQTVWGFDNIFFEGDDIDDIDDDDEPPIPSPFPPKITFRKR
ncbi:unnamed protein product [Tenebrio molitor]|nr:unnamed protein product [Tenebrio molitor]